MMQVLVNVNAKREGSYTLDAIKFRYNQLLKCTESLTRKGSRLHATKEQLLHATYAEDSTLKVLVKPPRPLLQVRCANGIPTLLEGETVNISFSLRNSGSRALRHLRVLCDNSHMSFIQEPGKLVILHLPYSSG